MKCAARTVVRSSAKGGAIRSVATSAYAVRTMTRIESIRRHLRAPSAPFPTPITTAQAAEGRPVAPQLIASELAAFKPVASLAPASPEQLRKPAAPRRHKMAQRRTHLRPASLARSASRSLARDEQVPALEAAPKVADRFDPIGSLIHGLG